MHVLRGVRMQIKVRENDQHSSEGSTSKHTFNTLKFFDERRNSFSKMTVKMKNCT